MSTATLTSKRQVTIPADVAKRLGVDVGDRIEFVENGDGEFIVRPATDDIRLLKGMLKIPKRAVSVDDMVAAVKRRGNGRKP